MNGCGHGSRHWTIRSIVDGVMTIACDICSPKEQRMISATKHQPPVPDKDTGYSKNPAANTVDVVGEPAFPVEPNSGKLQNMPHKDGQ